MDKALQSDGQRNPSLAPYLQSDLQQITFSGPHFHNLEIGMPLILKPTKQGSTKIREFYMSWVPEEPQITARRLEGIIPEVPSPQAENQH